MALLRVPGFITTAPPTSGSSNVNTIFSNEASAIINSITPDSTPLEILNAKKSILELGHQLGARPDVIDKQVSRLIKPLQLAQKKQAFWNKIDNARIAIDYQLGERPDLLKSPQDYVSIKIMMLDRLEGQLQSTLEDVQNSGDINTASKLQSQIDQIRKSKIEYLNALKFYSGGKGETTSLILVADVNPYNGQIYNGKYVTPEEYNREYQSKYLLLDKAVSNTNTKVAINRNNLRNNSFIYKGVTWTLPKNLGLGGIDYQSLAGSGVGGLFLQASGANVLVPTLPEEMDKVVFDVDIQPDIATGMPYVGIDNQSIYIKQNPNGKVIKLNIPDAQEYLKRTGQPYLEIHSQTQLRNIMSQVGKEVDIPPNSTSTIPSFTAPVSLPQQNQPINNVPSNIPGARIYRGKTGTPQQPRSNIWRTAGRIFGATALGPISAGMNLYNSLYSR